MPSANTTGRLERTGSVVLIGVESGFTPDVMDSIERLGASISATILLDDAVWDLAGLSPFRAEDAPAELRSRAFFVPRNIPGLRKAASEKARALGFSSLVSIVDPTSVISSMAVLGSGAHIASKVRIGHGTLVGTGASVAPGVTIGSNAVIGAGAAVHRDVPSNVVMVGNPARIAKTGIEGHLGYSA